MDNPSSEDYIAVTVETKVDGAVLQKWKALYDEYRPLLKPNKKSASEVLDYLQQKYFMVVESSERVRKVAELNTIEYLKRLGVPEQQNPLSFQLTVLKVENQGNGEALYQTQQQDYTALIAEWRKIHNDAEDISPDEFPLPILVSFEMNSSYVYVEGSPALSKEIEAFQGHNEKELENIYVVAHYVELLKEMNLLEAKLG